VRGGRLVLELRNPAPLARLVELPGGTSAIAVERERDPMVDRVTRDPAERRSRTERFIVRGWTRSKGRGNRFLACPPKSSGKSPELIQSLLRLRPNAHFYVRAIGCLRVSERTRR
jgi:hypothetical protein